MGDRWEKTIQYLAHSAKVCSLFLLCGTQQGRVPHDPAFHADKGRALRAIRHCMR
jgi:hypothetical protein